MVLDLYLEVSGTNRIDSLRSFPQELLALQGACNRVIGKFDPEILAQTVLLAALKSWSIKGRKAGRKEGQGERKASGRQGTSLRVSQTQAHT